MINDIFQNISKECSVPMVFTSNFTKKIFVVNR